MQPPGLGAPARPDCRPGLNSAHGCFPCIHGMDRQKRFWAKLAMAAAGTIQLRWNSSTMVKFVWQPFDGPSWGTLPIKLLVKISFATRALARFGYVHPKNSGTINSKHVNIIRVFKWKYFMVGVERTSDYVVNRFACKQQFTCSPPSPNDRPVVLATISQFTD